METPQRERERAFSSYKPCYYIEQVVKAISKCLGLERTEEEEEGGGGASGGKDREITSTSTTSRSLKKPSRPPLTEGRGGQVNFSSS
ncbi:elicitor peptide 6-like [Senna tora]|uniref:Elicitor peptide 6-like n=1 Tax=Senna tora TaxID=362788 RepID=A0A835CH36_9FABA|nr:elicitor peptide 6-like [Senna tora]